MSDEKTMRLLFPQWQGGNNPPYYLGAQLLAWLAPNSTGDIDVVPAEPPTEANQPQNENGIMARSAILEQSRAARRIIDGRKPDKIVVFGGDCSSDLAPFAYLNERYGGELSVLWLDAHPDVSSPGQQRNANTMVLGNLLGYGDAEFVKEVKAPLRPEKVMFAGLQKTSPVDTDFIESMGIRRAAPEELAENSALITQWLVDTNAKYLAIHVDLDVLDPKLIRSVVFPKMMPPDGIFKKGMTIQQLQRLIADVSILSDVVGMGIVEFIPWEAMAIQSLLKTLPLI